MASLKTVLYLGVCLSVWIITTADKNFVPAAEEVHWISLDFKTTLFWTTKASKYTYTVKYFRSYYADILTEPATMDHDYDLDEFPHTYSPHFNPYRETNISAVKFTVEVVDESRVIVNITDPLTSIHERGKQLSIRDILKSDLKYKISYYKSGSTGKRDIMSDSSTAVVSGLDAGQSYCFMVAAFIPSRPQTTQNGAWSTQRCTNGHIMQELSLGAWVGVVFILLIVLIIIITVTVLCCRCCRRRNKTLHTSQSSAPV
ncbi:tissue factor-like isoform X2 [Micropterus salmoides]|uniref:tissue factor-like isoform X2 n=1 Tax=Micropterus salmoides TaxID=27706 RepID=UPI0018EABAC4|nr:tissue factor-like isoform X2 [Micropterus salmoides]